MKLTRDEYQAVIDRTNQVSLEVAMQVDTTIADLVEKWAQLTPDAIFIYYNNRSVSYRQVNERADEFAGIALSRGISKGDTVALMMENRPAFFYVWFGMLKIGAVTALINTEAKARAVTHAVTTVDSKLAFVGTECMACYRSGDRLFDTVPTIEILDDDVAGQQYHAEPGLISYEQALHDAGDSRYEKSVRTGLKNSAIACYMFTSGTTGLPKAALITHSKWISTGQRWLVMSDLNSKDIFYCVLPIFHGAGLMSMFSTVLALGATCVLRRKFSASNFWSDVAAYNVTSFIYVGEICRYLTTRPEVPEEKDHKLRVIFGAGMGGDVWNRFTQRFGEHIKIYEGWGSTESNCSLSNLDNTPGSCGRIPYWNKTFMRMVRYSVELEDYQRNEQGLCIEAGAQEVGELLGQVHDAQGNTVSPFDGYSDDSASAKKLLHDVFEKGDCWFSTGDLFRYDEQGYFYFVDRMGDTFRWKSENVSTTEVAHQLSAYRDAELINVYGVKVPGTEGRAGMAALVMVAGKSFDPQAFYAVASANLSSFAMPLFVRIVQQMDMTGSYKLRKVDLQRQGYDPTRYADQLFVLDHQQKTYSPFSEQGLRALGVSPFE